MPELPEVETVRRGLAKVLPGKTISTVDLAYAGLIVGDSQVFCQLLQGQTFTAIKRRGKHLLLELGELTILSHLRMTGKYFYCDNEPSLGKHDHVLWRFEDGSSLVYNDVRKFGTLEMVASKDLEAYFAKKKLGPEPTEADFDLAEFRAKLARSKKAIKPLLLDQRLVVGLGNIYADEVLWRAKVHPEKPGHSLSAKEAAAIRQATIEVLATAIEQGGSTIRDYSSLGQEGSMQHLLQAYGRHGEPCGHCGTQIEKYSLAGRGTHYCPKCQRL